MNSNIQNKIAIDNKSSINSILSGEEFNRIFHDRVFVKLTNKFEFHHGFLFKDGLNVDTKKFNPSGNCRPGGLYFTDIKDAYLWVYYSGYIGLMIHMRKVTIPNDATIYIENCKFKTDKIILSQKEEISSEFILKAIERGFNILKFMPTVKINKEICLKAIIRHPTSFHYIPDKLKDKEICLLAVGQNG